MSICKQVHIHGPKGITEASKNLRREGDFSIWNDATRLEVGLLIVSGRNIGGKNKQFSSFTSKPQFPSNVVHVWGQNATHFINISDRRRVVQAKEDMAGRKVFGKAL